MKTAKQKYMHLLTLTERDEINLQAARAHYSIMDILRMGIAEAIKAMPQPAE